jgi:oligopeptide transport system permease protein
MAATPTVAQPFDFGAERLHTKQRGLWSQAFRRLIRNRLAMVAGILLVVITTVAVLGTTWSVVQRHDPSDQVYLTPANGDNTNASASGEHWLGTDNLGRDMWARMAQGTLFSLKVGFGAEFIVVCIGIAMGMTAALGGRLTDGIITWITDLTYAFPDLLFIILVRQAIFGRKWPIIGSGDPQIPGIPAILLVTVLAISFVSWVTICRLVRGQMLSIKNQDYVMAARAIGASQLRIVRAHMLPNTLSTVIVAITFGIPTRIFAEAALAFIGLGVPPPNASLGSLISDGQALLQSNNLLVVWPAIMVAALMLCFTFLGDGLRDAIDPRTRK